MKIRPGLLVALLFLLAGMPAHAEKEPKKSDPMFVALYGKFPKAPKELDSEPESTGIVLLAAKAPKGFKVAAAALERQRDSTLICMSSFEKNLVLFPGLEPGAYRLRILRLTYFGSMGDFQAMILPQADSVEVNVLGGGLQYLGLVAVHLRTIWNSSAALEESPAKEMEAWALFKEKYAGSRWIRLAEARMDSLGGEGKRAAERDEK